MQYLQIRSYSGTSLTEAIILLLIIIPLCLFIPRLAKIGDFKLTSPQTARYLGWQEIMTGQALTPTEAQLHIQERIFKNGQLDIQTHVTHSSEAHERNFWVDHTNDATRLLDYNSSQSIEITRTTTQDQSSIIKGIEELGKTLSVIGGARPGFTTHVKGQLSHELNYRINSFGFPGACGQSNNEFCLSQKHVIFIDDLAAESSEMIKQEVNTLKPFYVFRTPAKIMSQVARALFIFPEARPLRDAPLHVDAEVLPADLLER